jgi:hypothetical protein
MVERSLDGKLPFLISDRTDPDSVRTPMNDSGRMIASSLRLYCLSEVTLSYILSPSFSASSLDALFSICSVLFKFLTMFAFVVPFGPGLRWLELLLTLFRG